jgi:hypothetical protein
MRTAVHFSYLFREHESRLMRSPCYPCVWAHSCYLFSAWTNVYQDTYIIASEPISTAYFITCVSLCVPPVVARQRSVNCILPFVAYQRLGKPLNWVNIFLLVNKSIHSTYKSIDVSEFLLQYSFRNPIEFYYIWIVILCMYDEWCVRTVIVQTLCICTWLVPYAMVSTCIWIYGT